MSPRRTRGLRAIAVEADRVTAPIRKTRGLSASELITHWADVMGSALAAECLPLRLVRGPGGAGGTLHIRVGGALALELQHLQPQVIERINGYFGYRAISRIQLHQAPVGRAAASAPPAPAALSDEDAAALAGRLDTVADAGLRRALDALGRGVLARQRRHDGAAEQAD